MHLDHFAQMMATASQIIDGDPSMRLVLFWNDAQPSFTLVPHNLIGELGMAMINADNIPLCIITATDVAKFTDETLMTTVSQNWQNYLENLHVPPLKTHLTDMIETITPEESCPE